jgi:hypothetical protein
VNTTKRLHDGTPAAANRFTMSREDAQLISDASDELTKRHERQNILTSLAMAISANDVAQMRRIVAAVDRNMEVTQQVNAGKDDKVVDAVLADVQAVDAEREDRERPDRFEML